MTQRTVILLDPLPEQHLGSAELRSRRPFADAEQLTYLAVAPFLDDVEVEDRAIARRQAPYEPIDVSKRNAIGGQGGIIDHIGQLVATLDPLPS